MGNVIAKGECPGMYSNKYPKRNDPGALEWAKVREAELKAWKAENPFTCKKGVNKKRASKTPLTRNLKEQ